MNIYIDYVLASHGA